MRRPTSKLSYFCEQLPDVTVLATRSHQILPQEVKFGQIRIAMPSPLVWGGGGVWMAREMATTMNGSWSVRGAQLEWKRSRNTEFYIIVFIL